MFVLFPHLAILRLGINVLFLIHARKSGQRKNLTDIYNTEYNCITSELPCILLSIYSVLKADGLPLCLSHKNISNAINKFMVCI